MVTAASEMELFLPKSYDIFWSLVILIIVAESQSPWLDERKRTLQHGG